MSRFSRATADPALSTWLAATATRVDRELEHALPQPSGDSAKLLEAMRYALLGPGKRLRPAMLLAAYGDCGGSCPDSASLSHPAVALACALEMLHAYTLVHDDLPAMDDDDMRRGRPTVHRAFDEATAILAGDALLTEAFALLSRTGECAAAAVGILGRYAGHGQLLAGQTLDLQWQRAATTPTTDELLRLHALKTGALFAAAAGLGALCAGATAQRRTAAETCGLHFGIAFQIADDLDDDEHLVRQPELKAALAVHAAAAAAAANDFAPQGRLAAFARWAGQI